MNIKESLKFEFYLQMKPVFFHMMLTSIQSAFRFELMSVTPLFSELPCLIKAHDSMPFICFIVKINTEAEVQVLEHGVLAYC